MATPDFTLGKADIEALQRAILTRQQELASDYENREELYRLAALYIYLEDCFEVRIITE